MVITVTFDKLLQIMLGWKKRKRNERFENSQESNRNTDFSPVKLSGYLNSGLVLR